MSKTKKVNSSQTRISRAVIQADFEPSLKILKAAWDNLPQDLTIQEREVFYELSAELVKINVNYKKMSSEDSDSDKN